jgi:hypothetical protein
LFVLAGVKEAPIIGLPPRRPKVVEAVLTLNPFGDPVNDGTISNSMSMKVKLIFAGLDERMNRTPAGLTPEVSCHPPRGVDLPGLISIPTGIVEFGVRE